MRKYTMLSLMLFFAISTVLFVSPHSSGYTEVSVTLSYSVSVGYTISTDNPTFTYYHLGVLTTGTLTTTGVVYQVDSGSQVTPEAQWFTNAQVFTPLPASITPTGTQSQVFAYSTSSQVTTCNSYIHNGYGNVNQLWANHCTAPAIFYTFADPLTPAGFLALIFGMVEIPTFLGSKNMLLTVSVGAITAGALVTAFGSLDFRILALLWLAIALTISFSFVRLWKGRRQ